MKLAIVSTVMLFLVSSAHALQPGPARIKITAQLTRSTEVGQVYALYNRPAYRNRLGSAFVRCIKLPVRWLDCYETLRLSRGTIVARGVVSASSRFRSLAIVGGTGYYANVGGEMIVQPLGRNFQLILVDLQAF
jgi:hypothetical protein